MRWRAVLVAVGVALALLVLVVLASVYSKPVTYGFRPVVLTNVSHQGFEVLLARYVAADGRVDDEGWSRSAADLRALDAYMNQIANVSPDATPALFPVRGDALAYWINAYNALVLRAVLEHWPVASVRDVASGVSFVRGQGFFVNSRYLVGGVPRSLYSIENGPLRLLEDPRTHFAINCGSGGCPVLRPAAYVPATLDATLDASARRFVNDGRNVVVTKDAVRLSKIFEWYGDDFLEALRRPGATILDYVLLHAEPPLARELEAARARGARVEFPDYDWTINAPRGT